MGVYWRAIDEREKKQFGAPGDFSDKTPGIFHPNHPFPGMLVMMNYLGYHYELVNDIQWEDKWDYEDITAEVYEKYLGYFKE